MYLLIRGDGAGKRRNLTSTGEKERMQSLQRYWHSLLKGCDVPIRPINNLKFHYLIHNN